MRVPARVVRQDEGVVVVDVGDRFRARDIVHGSVGRGHRAAEVKLSLFRQSLLQAFNRFVCVFTMSNVVSAAVPWRSPSLSFDGSSPRSVGTERTPATRC